MFIEKHGQECARRFYFHDIIDSFDVLVKAGDSIQIISSSSININAKTIK